MCGMLGFSADEVATARIYDGDRDFTATSGPIWIRFTNGSIPNNAVAQRCSGSENSLTECNVRISVLVNNGKSICAHYPFYEKIIMHFIFKFSFRI